MRAHGAAPEDLLAGTSGGQINKGSRQSLPLELGEVILDRLRAEGIHDLHDWRQLGRRRMQIFGVTTSVAKKIDAAARRASQS